jgi:hypothetical protein
MDRQTRSTSAVAMTDRWPRLFALILIVTGLALPTKAEPPNPEGFWISDDLTPAGLGATLRFTSDGQVQATSGVILKLNWQILEKLEDGYVLSLINPFKPDDSTTFELRRVEWGEGMMRLKSTAGGMEAMLKFVSKGLQGDDPSFLGRWSGSVNNVMTIWDFTDDGIAWMRSPSRVGQGTYRIKGDKIVFAWNGKWPPVVSARIEGQSLVCKGKKKKDNKTFLTPDAAMERAMQP